MILTNQLLSGRTLKKICIIATSRETRWFRYGERFTKRFSIKQDTIRKLNRADAEALRDRMSKFGTLANLRSADRGEQIREILERSGRDLLVLIKELGHGEKFEKIVRSEVDDLSPSQRFAYFLVCLTHRVQVPMPYDLFYHTVRQRYPAENIPRLIDSMGRLIQRSAGSRSLSSRHATIAGRIVESQPGRGSAEIREALEALLRGFSRYQVPIIVHHSNTVHSRVFKSIINNKFLVFIFGEQTTIDIYRKFEKSFEKDAFFWQQFGLTYLHAGQHELALETLSHAVSIHDHPYIRHALAVAKLVTCFEKGPQELGEAKFSHLRSEGTMELEEVHVEMQTREDYGISALVHHDLKIANKYDTEEDRSKIKRKYHTLLAFYLRNHPNMFNAQEVYDRLHQELTSDIPVFSKSLGESFFEPEI